MPRIIFALLMLFAAAPLTACGDDDPKVISTGSGQGVTVVEDDD